MSRVTKRIMTQVIDQNENNVRADICFRGIAFELNTESANAQNDNQQVAHDQAFFDEDWNPG